MSYKTPMRPVFRPPEPEVLARFVRRFGPRLQLENGSGPDAPATRALHHSHRDAAAERLARRAMNINDERFAAGDRRDARLKALKASLKTRGCPLTPEDCEEANQLGREYMDDMSDAAGRRLRVAERLEGAVRISPGHPDAPGWANMGSWILQDRASNTADPSLRWELLDHAARLLAAYEPARSLPIFAKALELYVRTDWEQEPAFDQPELESFLATAVCARHAAVRAGQDSYRALFIGRMADGYALNGRFKEAADHYLDARRSFPGHEHANTWIHNAAAMLHLAAWEALAHRRCRDAADWFEHSGFLNKPFDPQESFQSFSLALEVLELMRLQDLSLAGMRWILGKGRALRQQMLWCEAAMRRN